MSIKESLESQKKQTLQNRLLRTLLCSSDLFSRVQAERAHWKKNPFSTEVYLLMNNCSFQYKALLENFVNLTH